MKTKSFTCHKHWMTNWKAGAVMLFFFFGAFRNIQSSDFSGALIAAVIGIAFFGVCYLISRFDYVTISNDTITGHKGVIRSVTLKSPIVKIQDVAISNGLLGKMFGYHTITISTAGSNGAEYVFAYMKGAKQFQNIFIETLNGAKQ